MAPGSRGQRHRTAIHTEMSRRMTWRKLLACRVGADRLSAGPACARRPASGEIPCHRRPPVRGRQRCLPRRRHAIESLGDDQRSARVGSAPGRKAATTAKNSLCHRLGACRSLTCCPVAARPRSGGTRNPAPVRLHPESLHGGPHGRVAISPGGKHIVYLGGGDEPKLWVRDIDREQPRELAGTEGARNQGLFWSPDSQFIGFAVGRELKKVSVQGGPAITVCQLPGRI